VDDGNPQRLAKLLSETFGPETQVRLADSGLAALEILRRAHLDVVLVDYLLPDMNGLELVSAMADLADDTAVILMSERGGGRLAADAIKSGARDYLDRHELNGEVLEAAVVSALRTARLELRTSRAIRQLRRDQAEVDHHVRGLAQDVQQSVGNLEHSINALKSIGGDAPLRQLVSDFSQVQQSLRRSLSLLHSLSERATECKA
jgi:DNA-binding NtrC family response regulator